MFENVVKFFKGLGKNNKEASSKDAAKERLHLVLMLVDWLLSYK